MLIKFKPNTPGQRGTVLVSKKHLSREAPFKSLTKPIKSSGGRNNQGRITSRRKGGGVKRKYREIDFKRNKFDINAEVIRNEYDPNRSAFISLIKYDDGEFRYILSPRNLKVGDKITSGENVEIKDIPINKWINVVLRCQGRKMDSYINGTIVNRHVFNAVPKQNYGDVFVTQRGGFDGMLSSLRYFSSFKKSLKAF